MMPVMSPSPMTRLLGPGPDPLEVLAGWPEHCPIAALLSCRTGSPFSRWSILAPVLPSADHIALDSRTCSETALLERIDGLAAPRLLDPVDDPDIPPFRGGRMLVLSYELGRALEPRAMHHDSIDESSDKPIAESIDCPVALVHDGETGRWWIVGDEAAHPGLPDHIHDPVNMAPVFSSQPLVPLMSDAEYAQLVARTVEYVHAGDIFQANIARHFMTRARFDGVRQLRGFSSALLEESEAWFGGMIELPGRTAPETIVSLSPELFLKLDPEAGTIRTRPIKGTLPSSADPSRLQQSEKDAAELAMIVDLMRNDLGRVADPGSVRVRNPRMIETHPGVHHGVADIEGRISNGTTLGSLLKATFPPGSVSGAPKVRAMQVIDEFEPIRRGPYCGAIGYSSACGGLALDVSIRTLLISELAEDPDYTHELRYGAGCGIVAESDPGSEAAESTAKAALLARFLEERSCMHAAKTIQPDLAHPV